MGVILLVRHGQASWGAADYDNLSELGHEQARITGAAPRGPRASRPTRVVCGSMRRHRPDRRGAPSRPPGGTRDVDIDEGWNEFDHVQMLEVHGAPEGGDGRRAS